MQSTTAKILKAHFKEPDRRIAYESATAIHFYSFTTHTSVCLRQYTAHHRGCWPEGHVTAIVGPQDSGSRGTSVDFYSRDEGRHCECYDILSVRAEENPASWSAVVTVSQYNEETLTFSLMVTIILTAFNDVFNPLKTELNPSAICWHY